MFDFILEPTAQVLNFFYGLVPNYAIAIILMTLLLMAVTSPLTLKGTKGMIKMQLLQPELKRIQEKHKGGDRTEMNAEMMAFYQENNLNPLGGCLPLLAQAPIFLVLYNVIRGLTRSTEEACGEVVEAGVKCFDPRYLDPGSTLYEALHGQTEMVSFGLDLAKTTSGALGESIAGGLPYLILILLMIGAQYFQQKQVSARNPNGTMAMPQQAILLKVMPVFFGVISINFPAALVVYWVTQNLCRIGLQAYITRSLYAGDDSLGAQAHAAAAKAREMGKDGKKGAGGKGSGGKDSGGKDAGGKDAGSKNSGSKNGGSKNGGSKNGGSNGKTSGPAKPLGSGRVTPKNANGNGAARPHSRSKKKKGRRR